MRSVLVVLSALVLGVSQTVAFTGTFSDGAHSNGQEFDYIVVGGGLAGLTVASRLSETNATVLVIEAGADSGNDPRVTDIYRYGEGFTGDLAWNLKTVSGQDILAGKSLGGSTAINGGMWTRGSKEAYNALPQFLGGDSASSRWAWDSMFRYMTKAEKFSPRRADLHNAGAKYDASFHGWDGKVQNTYQDEMYTGPHQIAFQQALVKNGVPMSPDAFGGDAAVSAIYPLTLDREQGFTRASARHAYWAPIEHTTQNMGVLVGHQVTKILTENTQGTVHAKGVQYQAVNGSSEVWQANARREVILAAGALKTPQVLMLSGIGPKDELQAAGVEVVLDRPGVGKNLQDQTMSVLHWVKKDGYNYGGKGPSNAAAYPNIDALSFGNPDDLSGTIMNGYSAAASNAVNAGAMVNDEGARKALEIQANLMTNRGIGLAELALDGTYPDGGFGIKVWNLLPFSRGFVRLADNNPNTPPIIDPRFFTAETDMKVQVQGCRIARDAFMSNPLSDLVQYEAAPGFDKVQNTDDRGPAEQWETEINTSFVPVSHPLGTCAMMAEEWGGVVNGNLTVYGTANIRVVDASVLPMQISAHLMNTLYGVAENAADIIKESW